VTRNAIRISNDLLWYSATVAVKPSARDPEAAPTPEPVAPLHAVHPAKACAAARLVARTK
jgi:hypothetical protein